MNFSHHFPGDDPAELRAAGLATWARLPYALRLISWYWASRASRLSWLMVIAMLLTLFGGVRLSIWLNAWERDWFDSLADKNLALFTHLSLVFFGVILVSVSAQLLRAYLELMIGFRWRDWLTQRYLDKWMTRLAYYRVERRGVIDNPDQRIAQDLQQLADSALRLGTGFLQFVTATASFGIVLWGLSGAFGVSVAGRDVQIPGYLVWAAIAYAAFGSWLVTFSGRHLVAATVRQETFEANFRYLLIHIRRGAEQLALYRGEAPERAPSLRFIRMGASQLQLEGLPADTCRCGPSGVHANRYVDPNPAGDATLLRRRHHAGHGDADTRRLQRIRQRPFVVHLGVPDDYCA